MKKIVTAISVIVFVLSCLFFVRFDSMEGKIIFADSELEYVNTRVSVAADGHREELLSVNVRLIYGSNALCLQRENCPSLSSGIRGRHDVRTTIGVVSFGEYNNCTGVQPSNCIRIKDEALGVEFNRILIGNIPVPRDVNEIVFQFPLLRDCTCVPANNLTSEATLKLKRIKRPLYMYIADMMMSV